MISSKRIQILRAILFLLLVGFVLWFGFLPFSSRTQKKYTNFRKHFPKIQWDSFIKQQNLILPSNLTVEECKRRMVEEAVTKPLKSMRKFDDSSPVRIFNGNNEKLSIVTPCAVSCVQHGENVHVPVNLEQKPDAAFRQLSSVTKEKYNILAVMRTMESASNVHSSSLDRAKFSYDIVMTPDLRSHVPVPYYSWVLQNFMKPLEPKDPKAPFLASAFISNCIARSFRLLALEKLLRSNITVDFHGECVRYVKALMKLLPTEGDDKSAIMRRYKFFLAFENSLDQDYVTEKFFASLVEGTVPVVIGAPNIYDFEPSENSILVIDSFQDVSRVAKKMLQLDQDEKAYNAMLAWKQTGPSDKFKALVDLSVVHSSCRLCIHVADVIRQQEECNAFSNDECYPDVGSMDADDSLKEILSDEDMERPDEEKSIRQCRSEASEDSERVELFLLRIRERGMFQFKAIFLDSRWLTVRALHEEILLIFHSITPIYQPVWTRERDDLGFQVPNSSDTSISNENPVPLRIYRVYPLGASQRAALYDGLSLDSDNKIANFVKRRPCGRLEVIFV